MDSDLSPGEPEDELYRTCSECGGDCPPEPIEVDGRLHLGFSCPAHGLHSVVYPHSDMP